MIPDCYWEVIVLTFGTSFATQKKWQLVLKVLQCEDQVCPEAGGGGIWRWGLNLFPFNSGRALSPSLRAATGSSSDTFDTGNSEGFYF